MVTECAVTPRRTARALFSVILRSSARSYRSIDLISRRLAVAVSALAIIAMAIGDPSAAEKGAAVSRALQAPVAVQQIMRRACYDCHSNETQWPWYSYLPVVSSKLRVVVEEVVRRLHSSGCADYDYDPVTD